MVYFSILNNNKNWLIFQKYVGTFWNFTPFHKHEKNKFVLIFILMKFFNFFLLGKQKAKIMNKFINPWESDLFQLWSFTSSNPGFIRPFLKKKKKKKKKKKNGNSS